MTEPASTRFRAKRCRALRIIHALATEIEGRGRAVECSSTRTDAHGRDYNPRHEGQRVVTINGHDLKLRIWEKGVGPRGPWEQQRKRWERERLNPRSFYLSRPKPYDSAATGELNIEILGYGGRQTSWGDRKRWRIEDRLGHLLRELKAQALEAEERRLARQREEAERQRRWEAAMEQAKRALVEQYRVDVLSRRVRGWHEADAIRGYCDAVEARHGEAVAADPEASKWLALAREHADELQTLPRMPVDPEITAEALKPFLGGVEPVRSKGLVTVRCEPHPRPR